MTSNGTYYFVVTAENEFGISSISNIEYVQILILPDLPGGNNTNWLPFISNEVLTVAGILTGLMVLFFSLSLIFGKKK